MNLFQRGCCSGVIDADCRKHSLRGIGTDSEWQRIPKHWRIAIQHHQGGQLQAAEQIYRQILQAEPNHADAIHLLGVLAHQVGQLGIAIETIERAIRLKGNAFIFHNNLGIALEDQGKPDEAVACYRRALELKPDFAEAHGNLGNALQNQGKLDEAVACFRRALELKPEYAETHYNLGNAWKDQGKPDEAIACYRRALELKPDIAEAHSNLGNALQNQGKLDETVACYRRALELKPAYAEVHSNLGLALQEQGKLDEAVACFRRALELKPDFAEAHYNLGLAWLLLGNFEQGWPEYESRYKNRELTPRSSQPLWDGSPLQSRTILLHMEQGWGDTLQFIRYARLIKQSGGRVALSCPLSLVNLLSSCPDIDWLPSETSPLPEFDVHAPLLSVPGLLKTSLTTIPSSVPYLFADPPLIDHWRQELSTPAALTIGIAWQGNPTYRLDRQRSIPLARFAPLAQLDGVKLFSLQKGLGTQQIDAVKDQVAVVDLGSRLDQSGANVCRYGGRDEKPRPDHHLGYGHCASGGRLGRSGLGCACFRTRLALVTSSGGFPLVPYDAAVPATGPGQLAGRVPANRR